MSVTLLSSVQVWTDSSPASRSAFLAFRKTLAASLIVTPSRSGRGFLACSVFLFEVLLEGGVGIVPRKLGHGLPTVPRPRPKVSRLVAGRETYGRPGGARSGDRAPTVKVSRLVAGRETYGRPGGHGRETVPQPFLFEVLLEGGVGIVPRAKVVQLALDLPGPLADGVGREGELGVGLGRLDGFGRRGRMTRRQGDTP